MNPHFGVLASAVFLGLALAAPAAESKWYELRVYYAAPGKLDALHARFRNHTVALFAKHGMENIGYWVPLENPEQKLIYVLGYPSKQAREDSWKAFLADPTWVAAHKASEAEGPLVAKIESTLLNTVDYSPALQARAAKPDRLFELRTYHAPPGKLAALNTRFRDHTVALFSKHGMAHIGYWVPASGQKGADDTLIYILAHRDAAARDASFAGFRGDPAWVQAKAASEKDGSLTLPNGVLSVLMKPTDYSPTR